MEFEALKEAITRVLQVYVSEIGEDSTFAGDLGADSIDIVQIFKIVEDTLDISIEDVDIDSVITVDDALQIILNCK